MTKLPNIHPGEILVEEFLDPMGISQNKLARAMKAPPRRINEIVQGKRGVTAATALRLAALPAPVKNSGSGYKTTTTWRKHGAPMRRRSRHCPLLLRDPGGRRLVGAKNFSPLLNTNIPFSSLCHAMP